MGSTTEIPGSGWERGANRAYLREICTYWREKFDWKAQIERLSAWEHYRYIGGDARVHFLYARGKGTKRIDLNYIQDRSGRPWKLAQR